MSDLIERNFAAIEQALNTLNNQNGDMKVRINALEAQIALQVQTIQRLEALVLTSTQGVIGSTKG